MARRDLIFNSFSAGEVSSRFEGRTDLEQYYRSCRILKNMVLATQGGAERRPGTYYVANGKTNGDVVRLIPFELASGNYILELGDLYIRFYKNHVRIENAGSPIEVVTPWAKADLFQLKFIQTSYILYVVHPSYDVKQLTRGADDNTWTLATVTFTGNTQDWALSSIGATLNVTHGGGGASETISYVHDDNNGTYSTASSTGGGEALFMRLHFPDYEIFRRSSSM